MSKGSGKSLIVHHDQIDREPILRAKTAAKVLDQTMSESTELSPKSHITTITVQENGPLEIQGEIVACGADGKTIREGKRMYLCRCGHSANKPFCDGTHNKIGFTDDGLGVKKNNA